MWARTSGLGSTITRARPTWCLGPRRWLDETANVRVHGTTGERPIDRLPREHRRPVAGIPRYRALILERRRVARDAYLSYAGSSYSVPAEYAGRDV
jgi:hypothetical protein